MAIFTASPTPDKSWDVNEELAASQIVVIKTLALNASAVSIRQIVLEGPNGEVICLLDDLSSAGSAAFVAPQGSASPLLFTGRDVLVPAGFKLRVKSDVSPGNDATLTAVFFPTGDQALSVA